MINDDKSQTLITFKDLLNLNDINWYSEEIIQILKEILNNIEKLKDYGIEIITEVDAKDYVLKCLRQNTDNLLENHSLSNKHAVSG